MIEFFYQKVETGISQSLQVSSLNDPKPRILVYIHSHGISAGRWKLLVGVSKPRASSDKNTKSKAFFVSPPLVVDSLILPPAFFQQKISKG